MKEFSCNLLTRPDFRKRSILRHVKIDGAGLLCRRKKFLARVHAHRDCANRFASLSEMRALQRALWSFAQCSRVELGVLLFDYGLDHCVNGVLDARKIIAARQVGGGGLQVFGDFSPRLISLSRNRTSFLLSVIGFSLRPCRQLGGSIRN